MKKVITAITIMIFAAGCNTPGVVWNDWVPSTLLTLAGAAGVAYAAYRYVIGMKMEKDPKTKDAGVGHKRAGIILARLFALILVFGIISYLA